MTITKSEDSTSIKDIIKIILAFGGLAAVFILIAFMGKTIFEDADDYDDDPINELPSERIIETTPTDSVIAGMGAESAAVIQSNDRTAEPTARTQEEIHADAMKKAAVLDERIQPYFEELMVGLDQLQRLKEDKTYTAQQLLDSIRKHGDLADEYIAEAFAKLSDIYPGITDREAWRVMTYSKAYTSYTRRASSEGKAYRQEYERRALQEGTTLK